MLRALALAAWIIAAAGPQLPGGPTTIRRDGIGIVIAIDVSSSMLAEDFAPSNRLEVAKRQAIEFIRGRDADRIGLVAFAGEALTQVPVTLDYAVLEQAVARSAWACSRTAPRSAAGSPPRSIGCAGSRKSKVVLLLTDGENNRGAIDPRTAADAAAAFGVKVYTMASAPRARRASPPGGALTGFRYEMLPVRDRRSAAQEIAAKTGGRYFRATDTESLSRIFQQIDQLGAHPVDIAGSIAPRDEVPRPFLLAGLGCWRWRCCWGPPSWCGRHELRLRSSSSRWRRCWR